MDFAWVLREVHRSLMGSKVCDRGATEIEAGMFSRKSLDSSAWEDHLAAGQRIHSRCHDLGKGGGLGLQ